MKKIININSKISDSSEIIGSFTKDKNIGCVSKSNINLAEEEYYDDGLNYGCICQRQNRYYKHTSKGNREISNFILDLKAVIQNNNSQLLQCDAVTYKCEHFEIILDSRDFLSVNNFKKTLYAKNIELIFRGKNGDLDDIKDMLFMGVYDRIEGQSHTGLLKYNEDYIYVGNDESIDKNGSVVNYIKYTGDAYLNSNITKYNPVSQSELKKISEYIFNYNELAITASILGFCSSCFLRERLYCENNIKGLHLVICGEAGSGKSQTLENIIMPFFSTNSKMSAEQCTSFVNVKFAGSSNTMPFIIEEYKPTRMSKTRKDEISALMRNGYDRTGGFRGNAKQKLNEYPVMTPIIIVGEMSPEETACLERSILLYLSKYKSLANGREEKFKYLKDNQLILKKLGRALLQEALSIKQEVLTQRYNKLVEDYSSLPGRVRDTAVVSMLGILLIKDIFDRNGLNFEDCTGYTVHNIFDAIEHNIIETVLEGNTSVKGIIERDIEILNDMVETGELIKGIDYQLVNSDTELALNIKMLYPKLLRYINSHNLKEIDKLSQNEFTKQLRLKEYYKDYKTIRFFHNSKANYAKAFVLNMKDLESNVGVDNFYM